MRRSADTDAEFAEFLAARSSQLYRSAYLLTTSSHAAEDLLQTALAKTYASWRRVRAADDPVAYVHGVLIKSFLSERRRRSSTELPVAEPLLELDRTQRRPTPPNVWHSWLPCPSWRRWTGQSWCCASGRTAASPRPPSTSISPRPR